MTGVVRLDDAHDESLYGSKAVGLHIIERAAITGPGQSHVKRVVAEMGGDVSKPRDPAPVTT